MTAANLELAFLAGILSTLSPCVLPLVPLLLGTAASEHRFGPVALAVGLALSFTAIGIFVATVGFAIGLRFRCATSCCRDASDRRRGNPRFFKLAAADYLACDPVFELGEPAICRASNARLIRSVRCRTASRSGLEFLALARRWERQAFWLRRAKISVRSR